MSGKAVGRGDGRKIGSLAKGKNDILTDLFASVSQKRLSLNSDFVLKTNSEKLNGLFGIF